MLHRLNCARRDSFSPKHDPLMFDVECFEPPKWGAPFGQGPGRSNLKKALVAEPITQVFLERRLELVNRLETLVGRCKLTLRIDEEVFPEILERFPLLRAPRH